jgi:hypothetical protein
MLSQYDTASSPNQTAEQESQAWAAELETYLTPYRQRLDAYLDRRVVGNPRGGRICGEAWSNREAARCHSSGDRTSRYEIERSK